MKSSFDNLNSILSTEGNFIDKTIDNSEITILNTGDSNINDIKKDYEYTRANLYSLIEKGQEAINGTMELAGEGGSPRAYEVAGQLIKSVADTTDKLIDLQKKIKDVQENNTKIANNVTNNAVFVGSTSELSKLLKQGFLNNNKE